MRPKSAATGSYLKNSYMVREQFRNQEKKLRKLIPSFQDEDNFKQMKVVGVNKFNQEKHFVEKEIKKDNMNS